MFATAEPMQSIVCYSHNYRFVFIRLLLAASLAAPVYAAGPTVERTGPLATPGVSGDLQKAAADKGYRIALDDGWTAEFWFASALATATKDAAGASYPELTNGEFVAVVNFSKGSTDYRGQAVPAGTYTLRYQYLPQDANHMGVSPNPDFLLAIPAAADPDPAVQFPFKKIVSLSAKTTGTAHPAVIAMAIAGSPATVAKDDQGMTIFTVEVPTTESGKNEKLGIVLKGQAAQ